VPQEPIVTFHENTKHFYVADNYIYTNNNKSEIGLTLKVVLKTPAERE
jgi:hypothetical protein